MHRKHTLRVVECLIEIIWNQRSYLCSFQYILMHFLSQWSSLNAFIITVMNDLQKSADSKVKKVK